MKNKTVVISLGIISTILCILIILFYALFVDELGKISYLNITMLIFGVLLNGLVVYGFMHQTNLDDNQLPFLFQFSGITTIYSGIIIALVFLSNIIPIFKVLTFIHFFAFVIWLITSIYFYLGLKNSQKLEQNQIDRKASLQEVIETFEKVQFKVSQSTKEESRGLQYRFNLLESEIKNLAAINNPQAKITDENIVEAINLFSHNLNIESLQELEFLIKRRKKLRSI